MLLCLKTTFLQALVQDETVLDFGLAEGHLFVSLFGKATGFVQDMGLEGLL